jgi:hypothetical protein
MYVNGKMKSVETIPGIEGGRKKRMMEGVNSSIIYLIYLRTFVNATRYPQHNNKK